MKILVLTRSFPPANRAASYRPLSWARYLKTYGIESVFITRSWESSHILKDQGGNELYVGTELLKRQVEGCDVYYVPYRNLRSRRFKAAGGIKSFLTKLYLIIEHIREYSLWVNDAKEVYRFALSHIKENEGLYSQILVTAPPYVYLKIGFDLHRSTGIPWVADYRDEWNSRGGLFNSVRSGHIILKKLDFLKQSPLRLEKNWVATSKFITVNTNKGVENLKQIFPKKYIYAIPNGFLEDEFKAFTGELFENFTLVYTGTLYSSQRIEVLLEACKQLLSGGDDFQVKLLFIGLNRKPGQVKRIKDFLGEFNYIFESTDVISKDKALENSQKAHALLMFPHDNNDSVAPSKLYEYVALEKSVLLSPSDNGVMEETLSSTGQASICNSVDETKEVLMNMFHEVKQRGCIDFEMNLEAKAKHSRKHHAQTLANLLKK